MKTLQLILISTITFFSMNYDVNAQVENGAIITFNKDQHDFGSVEFGGNTTYVFDFTNTGNEPLVISQAKGSCRCTVPSWPKEPIAPGATGSITVKYDSKRAGSINKSVTITSNAVNEPTKVLRISGNVLPQPESATPINNAGPVVE